MTETRGARPLKFDPETLELLKATEGLKLTLKERELLIAYRRHPEMQIPVDTLLGIADRDSTDRNRLITVTPNSLNRLRATRIEAGLTQEELAGLSGADVAIIDTLENGKAETVSSKTLRAIAKALNCSIADLFYL